MTKWGLALSISFTPDLAWSSHAPSRHHHLPQRVVIDLPRIHHFHAYLSTAVLCEAHFRDTQILSLFTNTKLFFILVLCTLFTLPLLTKLARFTRGPSISFSSVQPRAASMAWRSSGSSNEALINNLKQNGLIESDRVKEAMMRVLPSQHAFSVLFIIKKVEANTPQG
jgi:hypothetical protein